MTPVSPPSSRRSPATSSSTCPAGSPAPTAPSCSPTAAQRSSKSKRQKVIRCARWSASGAEIDHGDDGALFSFLACSKRSVVADPRRRTTDFVDALLARGGRGRVVARVGHGRASRLQRRTRFVAPPAPDRHGDHPVRSRRAVARPAGHRVHPAGVVGRHRRARPRRPGPGAGASSAARSGSGWPAPTPARRRWHRGMRGGSRELVDLSMLETADPLPHLLSGDLLRDAGPAVARRAAARRCRASHAPSDGLVALGCGTAQQWFDLCAMIGHRRVDRRGLAAVDHRAGQHARRRDLRVGARRTPSTRSSTWRPRSASPTRRSATAPTSPRSTSSSNAGRS